MMQGPMAFGRSAALPVGDVLVELGSGTGGLSASTAKARLAEYGPNAIAIANVRIRDLLWRQVSNPFMALLVTAAVVTLVTHEFVDAALISAFIVTNVSLGFLQEYRAEQAAKLLRTYWKNEAKARRDGAVAAVPSESLVPGDIVLLASGDRVPADIRLLTVDGCLIDESMLTGESAAIVKIAETMAEVPGDYHRAANIAFAGTTVQAGKATGVVIATGPSSSLGRIMSLGHARSGSGALEREVNAFSTFSLRLVILTLVVLFVINVALRGFTDITGFALFAIALLIGVIPEALPVVMIIAHTRAALLMAKGGAIVKRLSSIDDLGSIDVLCIDKTGTVTENALHVADVHGNDPDSTFLHALLASGGNVLTTRMASDAFDVALWNHADITQRAAVEASSIIDDIAFHPIRRRTSALVDAGGKRTLIVRGAPEAVLPLCSTGVPDELSLGKLIESEGYRGRRVFAVAARAANGITDLTENDEHDLTYLGLISFEDPLKRGAVSAVRKATKLGVRVKMLTGDAKEVAGAVAVRLGLTNDVTDVITGEEFDALPADEQSKAVERYQVFARVNPEHKYRILSLLEQRGAMTGFMGEGFNDGPALKVAHVGIAVDNAADIAKDAADVILTKKSLAAIVDGIASGRKSFANVVKYLKITLSANFGNFFAVAVASLFVPFLPMLPVQILLLNLLTDMPLIAVVGDTVPDEDLAKPRRYDPKTLIVATTLLGVVSSGFDFLTFGLFQHLGPEILRTLWFIESALSEIVLILAVRSVGPWRKAHRMPTAMRWLMIGVCTTVIALPYLPVGRTLFSFVAPSPLQLASVLGIVGAYLVVTEWIKNGLPGVRSKTSTDGV